MNERRLREELDRARPPEDAAARDRARAIVRAAYAGHRPPPRRRRLGAALPVAAALLLVLAAGALAATSPGAITDWVRDLVTRSSPAPSPAPALVRLPAAGDVLVSGPGGVWIVRDDGSRRRLGAYADATWSPNGRFVAATRRRELLALDPRGNVRWALASLATVRDPRWAPSGYRVAYRSGHALRVVVADGSGDRLVASRAATVAPAWRPGPRHELAYLDRSGRVVRVDVDRGRVLTRLRPGIEAQRLQWSASGRRLLVSGPRGAELLTPRGRVRVRIRPPAGVRLLDAQLAPGSEGIALLRRRAGTTVHEVLVRRPASGRLDSLFTAAGAIASVRWSPDGRLLLADWVATDQWLFLPAVARAHTSAVGSIAGHFDPGRDRPRGAVAVKGWCCPPGT